MDERRNINRGYRKLEVWQLAIGLFVFVHKKLVVIPGIPFKVQGQIEDSALSIPSNIAEGHSRRHPKEFIQHLSYSLGSLSENYTQLYALKESDVLDAGWFEEYDKMHYTLENKLISLIRGVLEKQKKNEPWNDDFKYH